ncbi:MAG: hypothetical protein ACREDT_02520 [Methylocella sp.]
MFCSNCGAQATGNFCAKCGYSLKGQTAMPDGRFRDWSSEVRYDTLILFPEVRDLIARAASAYQKRMSGEDFLGAADKVVSLVVSTVSLKAVAELAVPILGYLGIKTGKARSKTIQCPPGKAIVAVLCAFARQGQEIRQVQQFEDGCMLEAKIPSDFWSWEGSLFVTIHVSNDATRVDAATNIKVQLYDWGKSNRYLERLFSAIEVPTN